MRRASVSPTMLTPPQRQKITQFFVAHPLRSCQVCGSTAGYHIMDHGFMPDHPMNQPIGRVATTPMVLIHCANCFNVLMFYAAGMGITL